MESAPRLGFDISPTHHARQLDLETDLLALAGLARRCTDYLRLVFGWQVSVVAAPRVFLSMLRPTRVPVERSFVLGIYRREPATPGREETLVGVLYFLHPPEGSATWYLSHLLLEPAVRGRNLGTETHAAFTRWSAVRGARRLIVSVADNNPRALHFWRDRLGYGTPRQAVHLALMAARGNRHLERSLEVAPWGVRPARTGDGSRPADYAEGPVIR